MSSSSSSSKHRAATRSEVEAAAAAAIDRQQDARQQMQADPYNQPESARYSLLEQQYLAETARAEQQQQYAYDSMSTILEVDSEESEASDRYHRNESLRDYFAATQSSPGSKRTMLDSTATGSEIKDRSMSPIAITPEAMGFSGALSALAQQVERLSRGETSGASPTTASHQHERSAAGAQLTSSRPDRERPQESSASRDESDKDDGQESTRSVDLNSNDEESFGEERPRSRPVSAAESLMMIALSPMPGSPQSGSGRVAPLAGKQSAASSPERLVVEVSNKSTITSIDSNLMDKMVEKYFVDKLDKASQSIAFDCEESGDTREFKGGRRAEAAGASAASGKKGQPQGGQQTMKSVAVGTEKFSRERFSLLPPTKTRSTQTKSNIDNDIGASETRRFKLSHLDFGSLKRRANDVEHTNVGDADVAKSKDQREQENTSTVIGREDGGGREEERPPSGSDGRRSATESPVTGDRSAQRKESHRSESDDSIEADQRPPDSRAESEQLMGLPEQPPPPPPQQQQQRQLRSPIRQQAASPAAAVASTMQRDSLTTGAEAASAKSGVSEQIQPQEENKGSRRKSSARLNDSNRAEISTNQVGDGIIGTTNVKESFLFENKQQPDKGNSGRENESRGNNQIGLIGNLKTELRVIIELSDLRHKQRSEVTSNSQLIDGKLSKQTQINTSKHVVQEGASSAASSPREVYRRLDSAGREHSLMYNNNNNNNNNNIGRFEGTVNSSPLRTASSMSSLAKGIGGDHKLAPPSDGTASTSAQRRPNWRQISKSSVCNEIETDTHRSWRKQPTATTRAAVAAINDDRQQQQQQLLMSTDARIRHLPDNKSALELKSRAARRYERLNRDPLSRQLVGSGQIVEQTLVQSEAGFDENELPDEQQQRQPPSVAHGIAVRDEAAAMAEARVSKARATRLPQSDQVDHLNKKEAMARVVGAAAATSEQTRPMQVPRNKLASCEETAASRKELAAAAAATAVETKPPPHPRSPTVLVDEVRSTKRTARLEIEQENEERRQVTRNGRLVFDDRLNERRYETHRSGSPLMQVQLNTRDRSAPNKCSPAASPVSSSLFSSSPVCGSGGGGILRNRHVHSPIQRQLLKPISLRASPTAASQQQQQPADATSNLSSDLETMDSGIAQSGAGSSNALNQQRPPPLAAGQRPSPASTHAITIGTRGGGGGAGRRPPSFSQQQESPEPNSLTFVDDDDDEDDTDELVDQLGSEKANKNRSAAIREAGPSGETGGTIKQQRGDLVRQSGLILPPAQFRSNISREKDDQADKILDGNTELVTRLTRSHQQQRLAELEKRATRTRFEQNLAATPTRSLDKSGGPSARPIGCKLKAQVVFESDTDSSMVLEQQQRPANLSQKELFSETKYSNGGGDGRRIQSPLVEVEPDEGEFESTSGKESTGEGRGTTRRRRSSISSGGKPAGSRMDYSLRVLRMRGSQIDSKVNTYIEHSRQPLINSEAS